jgi:hypothetical protein
VHYLVAAPAALVLAGIAVATFVEARHARSRGPAVLREDELPREDQPDAAGAAKRERSADDVSVPQRRQGSSS